MLAGHVLISSIREAKRLKNLSSEEVADLFRTVQRVQQVIEQKHEANASTIAVQDGIDAGQSVEHVHVHILPRKPTDFGGNIDLIYLELQKHDKEEHNKKFRLKTFDEMKEEAISLRKYFN